MCKRERQRETERKTERERDRETEREREERMCDGKRGEDRDSKRNLSGGNLSTTFYDLDEPASCLVYYNSAAIAECDAEGCKLNAEDQRTSWIRNTKKVYKFRA